MYQLISYSFSKVNFLFYNKPVWLSSPINKICSLLTSHSPNSKFLPPNLRFSSTPTQWKHPPPNPPPQPTHIPFSLTSVLILWLLMLTHTLSPLLQYLLSVPAFSLLTCLTSCCSETTAPPFILSRTLGRNAQLMSSFGAQPTPVQLIGHSWSLRLTT